MIVIVGLGNPQNQYINTPHNLGFKVVDELWREGNFPDFKMENNANALISERDGVVLMKPQTFMNESGKAVKAFLKNKNVSALIVIHDDIDLKIGEIKLVLNRGSAGHKGVESIMQELGSEDFKRLILVLLILVLLIPPPF